MVRAKRSICQAVSSAVNVSCKYAVKHSFGVVELYGKAGECYSLLQFVTILETVTFVNWPLDWAEGINVTMLQ